MIVATSTWRGGREGREGGEGGRGGREGREEGGREGGTCNVENIGRHYLVTIAEYLPSHRHFK